MEEYDAKVLAATEKEKIMGDVYSLHGPWGKALSTICISVMSGFSFYMYHHYNQKKIRNVKMKWNGKDSCILKISWSNKRSKRNNILK